MHGGLWDQMYDGRVEGAMRGGSVGSEGHGELAIINAWWSLGSVGPWEDGRGHTWWLVGW